MRAIVQNRFVAFTEPLEGAIRCLYLDIKGYVTTAIGLLVDDCRTLTPPRSLFDLPMRVDGREARGDELAAEWRRVAELCCEATLGSERRTGRPRTGDPLVCTWRGTSRVCLAHRGWLAAMQVTRLRLSDEGVERVTRAKLDDMWRTLVLRFPRLDRAPADAQLGLLSMAWALGPHFAWPKFAAAVRAEEWAIFDDDGELVGGAAFECRMLDADNPGVRKRNERNRALFLAAARVVEQGLDPDVLWGWAAPDEVTRRDLPSVPPEPDSSPTVLVDESLLARRAMTIEAVADFVGDDED